MPASLLCSLCSDPCSSVEDLRNHLRSTHDVKKKDLGEHIMKTMEEQIKKQESSAEVVTLDEDEEKGEIDNLENTKEQLPDNFKQPNAADKDFKANEEDVKEFFKLKGESVVEAMLTPGSPKVEASLSFEEVMAKLAWMKKEVRTIVAIILIPITKKFFNYYSKVSKLKIPKHAETQLKREFDARRQATPNTETGQKSFKTPTRITMFFCPRAPSCSFSLSKAEMRGGLPLDHLIQEHNIQPADIAPGQTIKFSKKYIGLASENEST